ncbi:uncharacterized protein [Typha latifolia]|uniref:uncharacterized protein isoform X2 n=1 Tax=Typha latifolia TaxID=4733 RepID=UPI003C2F42DD
MEEFSFPTIVENQKPIFQLPFPTSGTLLFSSKPSTNNTRRSFSLVEGAFDVTNHSLIDKDFKPSSPALSDYGSGGGNHLLEDEERMDKLWEDFNDDFFCASPDRDRSGVQMMSRRLVGGVQRGLSVQLERHRALELQLLPTLGASKSVRAIRYKRPSLGVMLRALKKLFIVQRTHQSSSKRRTQYQ